MEIFVLPGQLARAHAIYQRDYTASRDTLVVTPFVVAINVIVDLLLRN